MIRIREIKIDVKEKQDLEKKIAKLKTKFSEKQDLLQFH